MADKGQLKSVIRSLIISSPKGITIQQLRNDYMEQEGFEIPYAKFGFTRLNDFLNSLKDTCYVRINGPTTKVYAIQSTSSNHINKMVQEQKKSRKPARFEKPPRFQKQSSTNYGRNKPRSNELSLPPCNWSSSYQPLPRTDSPNTKYMPADILGSDESVQFDRSEHRASPAQVRLTSSARQNNLNQSKQPNALSSQSIAQIQEITTKFQKVNTKKTKHYNIKPSQCTEALPILQDDDEVFHVGLPKDVAKLGAHIALSTIPADVQKGSVLEIIVSEINNPFRFWFHIKNDQYKLNKLMNDIGEYYNGCFQGELNLPASRTCIGQLCAALVLGLWHRAEVVQPINGNGDVKVYCIDFGTIAMVPLMQVKFLLNKYCTVPSQAYRGCLAYIQPTGTRWKREASFYFLSLVPNAMIYAKVEDIHYEDRVLRLLLIDTNGEHDLQINEALVGKGIAKPMLSTEEPNGPTKRHYCERYPTFDLLETAKYPSLAEIGLMLNKGVDFEAMQDENIIPELDISCKNMSFGEQIGKSFCETSTSIQHEISSDNHIQDYSSLVSLDDISSGSYKTIELMNPSDPAPQLNPTYEISSENHIQDYSSLVSLDDISSGSFESIENMQRQSDSAPQRNPALQTRELSGIVKPTAAGPVDSLGGKSDSEDDINNSELNNPYQFDEQLNILSSENHSQFDSSSEQIPLQVSPILQDRELLLPRDTMTNQPQTTCWPLEKDIKVSHDLQIVPDLNISFQNLKFDEYIGNFEALTSTQLDISSENNSQAEKSFGSTESLMSPLMNTINAEPEVSPDSLASISQDAIEIPTHATSSAVPIEPENTQTEQITSQPINNGLLELPQISDFVVEQLPSVARYQASQFFNTLKLRQPNIINLQSKSLCEGLVHETGATAIENLLTTPESLKTSVSSLESLSAVTKNTVPTSLQTLSTTSTLPETSTPPLRPPRKNRTNKKTHCFNTYQPMNSDCIPEPLPYQPNPPMMYFPPYSFLNFPPDCLNYPYLPMHLMPFMPNMDRDPFYYRNHPPPYVAHKQ